MKNHKNQNYYQNSFQLLKVYNLTEKYIDFEMRSSNEVNIKLNHPGSVVANSSIPSTRVHKLESSQNDNII